MLRLKFRQDKSDQPSLQGWQLKSARTTLGAVLAACTLTTACSSNSGPSSTSPAPSSQQAATATAQFSDRQVVSDFANQVVVPTNQRFAQRAKELSSVVNTFVKNPNDQTLKAAQAAWVAARSPWEQSECFTFGPADSLGYDAALDSWPVNETDLKAVLQSQDQLTPTYVEQLKDTEKGFHVIEYLLFGESSSKQAADFTQRELSYLQALTTNFSQVANELVSSWTQGVEGQPAYQEVIATAGESDNSTYPTLQAGAAEIVQGMIDSLDEVANEKIGETLEQKDPKLAESRFSLNTLTDLKSNIQGAQNVYLGRFPAANTEGTGLSTYIAKVNPDLDARVKREIQAALDALNQIPSPLEQAIADPQAADAIKAAQEKINQSRNTIEQEVLPLVQG